MELLYLRIKNYKCLSNVGLNFSNAIRFDFDEKNGSLNIQEAKNFIPKFFGENINNFTGIIGENGVGKTSILRYILQYFTGGINQEDEAAIVAFKVKNQFYYYSKSEITLTGSFNSKEFQKVEDLDDYKPLLANVYLSNHFDPSSFYSDEYTQNEFAGMRNLSTYFLMYSDIQSRFNIDMHSKNLTFNNRMEAFAANEFKRIVRVLKWINRKSGRNPFPASAPPYLNLRLLIFYDESITKQEIKNFDSEMDVYFFHLTSKNDRFLLNTFRAFINHVVNQSAAIIGIEKVRNIYAELGDRVFHALKDPRIPKTGDEGFITLVDRIFNDIIVPENQVLHSRLKQCQEFLKYLNELLKLKSARISQDGIALTFRMSEISINKIEDLVNEFYSIEKIGDYAEFYFSHAPFSESSLSSGEYVLLSLFGRLNSLKVERNQSFLFLIDEAELGLHPQWQKQFVSLLTDFINERFKGVNVQIILTSHSPFILSDLPPHCNILLRKKDQKTFITDMLESKPETFGANIHELFTDSFFLQNGLLGEFARQRIDDLVKEVYDKKEFDKEYYNKVRPLISIIGEPFVRGKLLEKLLSGMKEQDADYLIQDRERELQRLKQFRNDQNRVQ